MFKNSKVFSSFSVNDVKQAKAFYSDTLGLEVSEMSEGLSLNLTGGGRIFLYPKSDHQPATFTVLNFLVDNIDDAVDELKGLGVTFESYSGDIATDEKCVFRGNESGNGPDIAWFKDPSGNILSVVHKRS